MQSYIEIKVPIRYEDSWFRQLRDLLDGVNIRWQRGYYHITMAFLDFAPDNVNLVPGLNDIVDEGMAPTITFDKLDAFASGYHRQVIHLTTTDAPDDFLALVKDLRHYFKAKGCKMQSDFKLHVTLGRAQDPRMNVNKLQDIISQVDLPALTMELTDVEYRILRGKTLGQWKLLP
ncbi:MAG: 2'-5' RNA ligase family protein [Muribaculaceae bacterium]|nr:2'-5' RNA ligase family protein [Muribaculaceae bacterium]